MNDTTYEPAGPTISDELLQFAVTVTRDAGHLSADHFLAGSTARRKADGSEVTDTDIAVEDLVRARIARFAPADAVLGEEAGESSGTSGRRWVVDPVSGTAYFSRRMPLFANLLAYEDEHGPAIGVINLPIQQETVFAARGRGCWLLAGTKDRIDEAHRTRVGDRNRLDGALTLGSNQHAWPEELLLALHRNVALAGAIHHAVLHVVTGRVDVALLTHQSYDDLAPLPVILSEAGGLVSDLDGRPVLTGDGTALAANPALHGHLLRLLAHVPRPRGSKALS